VGKAASLPGSGSLLLRRPETEQGEPVRMALAGHQFPRAFAVALRPPAAHETTMVQEEPQQVQILATQVATQREVIAQPRVEVFHQRTAARGSCHGPAHGVKDRAELAAELCPQPVPPLPIRGRGSGQAVQYAGFTHERFGDLVGLRDVGQLGVEYTGEGEQIVALVPQGPPRPGERVVYRQARGASVRQ
jgi:hypothetical protein